MQVNFRFSGKKKSPQHFCGHVCLKLTTKPEGQASYKEFAQTIHKKLPFEEKANLAKIKKGWNRIGQRDYLYTGFFFKCYTQVELISAGQRWCTPWMSHRSITGLKTEDKPVLTSRDNLELSIKATVQRPWPAGGSGREAMQTQGERPLSTYRTFL